MIRSQSKPTKLDVAFLVYVPNHHKRKPRSLVMSPAIDHLCATSALDGVVNFWKITQDKAYGLNLSLYVDCISPGQRRWPEDLAWHPHGEHCLLSTQLIGDRRLASLKLLKRNLGTYFSFLKTNLMKRALSILLSSCPGAMVHSLLLGDATTAMYFGQR
ncbi:hypothetical protein M758_UG032200 [Ceratodon purpureus]|nr:hypothetical protein M758_UG032200 [Ceratodon purpureus]